MESSVKKTDFLVIGGGVAGLRAAIELACHGDVIVLTKGNPTECSTEYAQGGVAVAMSSDDKVELHYEDTIKAGDGLCREDAVKTLVEEDPNISVNSSLGAPSLTGTAAVSHLPERALTQERGCSIHKAIQQEGR